MMSARAHSPPLQEWPIAIDTTTRFCNGSSRQGSSAQPLSFLRQKTVLSLETMENDESNEKDEFSEQDISPAENDTNTSAISDKTSCTTCLKLKLQAVGHTVGVSSTKIDFIRDVSLCIAVAGAAAFFVGTDFGFPQNWLRSVVGERDGSDKFLDCLRSGFSTFLGFICFSIAQILLIPNRYLWTAA